MNIYLASDHAGFELKNKVRDFLETVFVKEKRISGKVNVLDLGPQNLDSVDYPDFADLVCQQLKKSDTAFGILICGSGQGMVMRANKYPFIRAALVYNDEIAKLAREHNDANVICIGSRFCTPEDANDWVNVFLQTPFAGGRHQTRVAKIGSVLS
ncbi:MAG: RpiB/LacA/LacB family sugar-phosphate isomerase [Bdellovibrio sp.]|nr:RpiB/LacA/LacB family sugar-phosphate isomerase [Bdellovibrio sp.]